MTTPESGSVEIEHRKQEQDEAHAVPSSGTPATGLDVERGEAQSHSVQGIYDVAAQQAVPQYSSELSFACLLLPRFSDHYLAGDIVDALTDWMKQVCISYGWRLEALSIRPGYMQWVMKVPLNANPAQFMRVIRRHTSARIFEDFPRFKQKNVSGEFWAPGNFVVPGDQLQPPEQVNQFILQTRRQQGLV